MSKVFTGNVFITSSRAALDKIFFSKNKLNSFNSVLSKLSDEDLKRSIIASPNKNSNLLEFDFDYGVQASKMLGLRLRFVETGELFESYYLGTDINSDIVKGIVRDITNDSKLKTGITESAQSYVYFAFGVGDDLRNWSGPYALPLMSAEMFLGENGIREVELVFTGAEGGLLRNAIESYNESNFNTAVNRYSFLLSTNNIFFEQKEILEDYKDILASGIHSVVKKLISGYISNITNNNEVLVLIPDVKKVIDVAKNSEAYKEGLAGLQMRGYCSRFARDVLGLYLKSEVSGQIETIPLSHDERVETDVPRLLFESDTAFQQRTAMAKSLREYVRKNGPGVMPKEPHSISLLAETGNSSYNFIERTPDYYIPLKIFENSFKSSCQAAGFAYNQELYMENDIRVLRLWKECGFIKDSSKPAYIIGDRDLINSVLYLTDVKTLEDTFIVNEGKISDIDKKIYVDESGGYRVKFYNEFIKRESNSSFGENVFIKDELALDDNLKSLISISNLPFFRHNIRNPNVISLSISNNTGYRSVYDLGMRVKNALPYVNVSYSFYREDIETSYILKFVELSNKIEKELNINISNSYEEIVNKILLTLRNDNLKLNNSQLIKSKTGEYFNKKELAVILAASIFSRLNKGNKPYIEINSKNEFSIVERELIEQLNRLSNFITIKTVPFFSLAGNKVLGTPCALVGKLGSITKEQTAKAAFYTGVYSINGFRHYISASEMFSEFSLVKSEKNNVANTVVTDTLDTLDSRETIKNLFKNTNVLEVQFAEDIKFTEDIKFKN